MKQIKGPVGLNFRCVWLELPTWRPGLLKPDMWSHHSNAEQFHRHHVPLRCCLMVFAYYSCHYYHLSFLSSKTCNQLWVTGAFFFFFLFLNQILFSSPLWFHACSAWFSKLCYFMHVFIYLFNGGKKGHYVKIFEIWN